MVIGKKAEGMCGGSSITWRFMLSGVPQGSVLGPLIIFINDLELQIINTVLKFADDTKVFGTVIDEDDRAVFQEDLQKLSEWADSWQMEFNVEKCKVTHFGSRNNKFNYSMREKQLEVVSVERDLGVITASNLKVGIIVSKHMPQQTECWGLSHERSNTRTSALWYTSTKVWFGLT